MPKSRGRKKGKGAAKRPTKRRAPSPLSMSPATGPHPAPPISKMVDLIMSGSDIEGEDDPLMAELWASHMLGTTYKLPLPIHVRDQFESSMTAGLLEGIEEADGEAGLSVLRALAAVAPDPIGPAAGSRADELVAQGTPDPPWAAIIGKPEFLDAWMSEDPYGDQRMYIARFQYPGRDPHTITTLYDVNLGGIVKDAFVGYTKRDLRDVPVPDDMTRTEIDAQTMATEILAGIGTGDMYLDNDWTDDFKDTRTLAVVRMMALVDEPPKVPPEHEPVSERKRQELIKEFLASQHATELEDEDLIVDYAVTYRCDFADGDPLRWSPIGVELFMLDHLPRKTSLGATEIRHLPAVLKAWIRFALNKRGLDERWITETVDAVDHWTRAFRQEVTNPDSFGPAKAITHAMLAEGIDLTDEAAVGRWIEEFNRRPFEERDEFLRDR